MYLPVISVQRVVMKVSRSVEYSYAVFGKPTRWLHMIQNIQNFWVYQNLLLIGGVATVFGYCGNFCCTSKYSWRCIFDQSI